MAVSDLTVNEITSLLEGLIENPYMFYVIVDSDGLISSINQTYLDILEMKKEDVVGQHYSGYNP